MTLQEYQASYIYTEDGAVAKGRRELELIGEEPETIEWYVRILKEFYSVGHSGTSAEFAAETLITLLYQGNLSPLTDSPEEWDFYDDKMFPPDGIWQNNRNGKAFSNDSGKTYWILDMKDSEGNSIIFTSVPASVS